MIHKLMINHRMNLMSKLSNLKLMMMMARLKVRHQKKIMILKILKAPYQMMNNNKLNQKMMIFLIEMLNKIK